MVFWVTGLILGIEGSLSMFQKTISSKEWVVVVAVAVEVVVVEGRATNPDNRLVCPTLKIVGSGLGSGPLPLFFDLFFRGAFALAVLSESEEVDLGCVVMDRKEGFCLEPCLDEVGLQLRGADF